MAVSLGEAILKIGADSSTFERKLMRIKGLAKHHMDAAASTILQSTKRIMLAGAAGIAAGMVYSIKKGMDAVESENLFEVSMAKMADKAREWSIELSKSLGLNQYEIRKNIGTFNVMLKSMGLAEVKAYEMAKAMTKLAYDMASFYNLSNEEAFEKLRAGISGEAEPLKRLGILINENAVKQFAWANGIAKAKSELDDQQKTMARFGLIMKQTQLAQGDLERTQGSLSNQVKRLKSQWQEFATTIGMRMVPRITELVSKLSEWVSLNFDEYARRIGDAFDKWAPKIERLFSLFWRYRTAIVSVGAAFVLMAAAVKTMAALNTIGAFAHILRGFASEQAAKAGVSIVGNAAGTAAGVGAGEIAAKAMGKRAAKEIGKEIATTTSSFLLAQTMFGAFGKAGRWGGSLIGKLFKGKPYTYLGDFSTPTGGLSGSGFGMEGIPGQKMLGHTGPIDAEIIQRKWYQRLMRGVSGALGSVFGGLGGGAVAGVAGKALSVTIAGFAGTALAALGAAVGGWKLGEWINNKWVAPWMRGKDNRDLADDVTPTSPEEKARRIAMMEAKRTGSPEWYLRAYGGVSTAPFKAPFGRPGDMGFPQGALERIFAAGSPEARARAERNRMLASYDALNAVRLAESKRPVQRVLNPATGRMELPQTPGGMSVNIQTINVTADSVGDAKRFEQMLVNRAHAAMP